MTTERTREEITAEIEALEAELEELEQDAPGSIVDKAISEIRERAARPNPLRTTFKNPLIGR